MRSGKRSIPAVSNLLKQSEEVIKMAGNQTKQQGQGNSGAAGGSKKGHGKKSQGSGQTKGRGGTGTRAAN